LDQNVYDHWIHDDYGDDDVNGCLVINGYYYYCHMYCYL